MMKHEFDNNHCRFYESGKSNDRKWTFYKTGNLSINPSITLAFSGIKAVLTNNIIIDGNRTENDYGVTYWVNYQDVDVNSIPYQKMILSLTKGISESMADNIFDQYGFKHINEMVDYISKGGKVAGIGKKKAESVKKQMDEAVGMELMNKLTFIMGYKNAKKVSKNIDDLDQLYKHPYKTMDAAGIGFKSMDDIAINQLNVSLDNEERNFYLVEYKYNQYSDRVSNYIEYDKLKEFLLKSVELNVDVDSFIRNNELLVVEYDRVYLARVYTAENDTPLLLKNIKENDNHCKNDNIDNLIKLYQEYEDIQLDTTQIEAIKKATQSNLTIITGGAGTGKSTIIKGVVSVLESSNFSVIQLAPTGKAAVRMKECTGRIANTIHSLICFEKYVSEFCPTPDLYLSENYGILSRNKNGSYLIIDEFSMVDQLLFFDLLNTIEFLNKEYYTNIIGLIIIGDPFQLPSVGRGNVLANMIDSKVFNHIHLTKTFRQAENSNILINANNVREKQVIEFMKKKDFYVTNFSNETFTKHITHLRNKYSNELDFIKNVQVCTLKNSTCESIRDIFKTILGKEKGDFKAGDKVINCKNDKEYGISNGDMGIIEKIVEVKNDKGKVLETLYTIFFYDLNKRVTLSSSENLKTGYCCTVHKLQGSEYKTIIIILEDCKSLLEHRLLYTAITRGKENCIIFSPSEQIIIKACQTSNDYLRKTFFKENLVLTIKGNEFSTFDNITRTYNDKSLLDNL